MTEASADDAPVATKETSPAAAAPPKAPARTEKPAGKALPPTRPSFRSREEHRKWKRIEWIWTLVPVGLLIAVAVPSTILLYALDTGPTAFGSQCNFHVDVIGQQWLWSYKYTDPYGLAALPSNVTGGAGSTLYVPQNAVVCLNVTSVDVDHSFFAPQLGVHIDAIPGQVNHAWLTIPAGAGIWTEYLVECGEFCGQGHYSMLSKIVVVPPANLPPS